eukprot:342197-Chlamydomonas_euryale.AAC.2
MRGCLQLAAARHSMQSAWRRGSTDQELCTVVHASTNVLSRTSLVKWWCDPQCAACHGTQPQAPRSKPADRSITPLPMLARCAALARRRR